MSEVVSSISEGSEKDKGNVGRLTLLVVPIRDRTQLNPRLHPANERPVAAILTDGQSEGKEGRGKKEGEKERERESA